MGQVLTREHVESFRRARMTHDARQIEPFLADDVDWLLTGPVELLSFCGQRNGKAEVLNCLTEVQPTVLNVKNVELGALLIDGDRAASFSRMTGVQPGTGRTISYHQAQFMRFRDGKIVEYRGIIDSFDAAEQMIGHRLELNSPSQPANGDRVAV
jgi:ketosteroid isomerase-like protein